MAGLRTIAETVDKSLPSLELQELLEEHLWKPLEQVCKETDNMGLVKKIVYVDDNLLSAVVTLERFAVEQVASAVEKDKEATEEHNRGPSDK